MSRQLGNACAGINKLAYLRGICILIWMEDCLQLLVVSFYLLLVNVKGLPLTACHSAVSTCKAMLCFVNMLRQWGCRP